MSEPLRIVVVEDVPADAALAEAELRRAGIACAVRRVETEAELLAALEEHQPDLVLSDYSLPAFDGMKALRIVMERAPEVPFIVITGSINEETAVACMRAGAWDYVLKDRLSRLPSAVRSAIDLAVERRARAAAEAAFRESEARCRHIVAAAKDGVWEMDAEHCTTFVNRAMAAMLGYEPDEMLGRRVETFFFADDLGDHAERMRARHTGADDRYVRRFARKDGGECWCMVSATANRDDEGRFSGSFGVFTDITERVRAEEALRRSEQRFQTLFQGVSRIAVQGYAADGTVTFWNKASEELYGYTAAEALGANLLDLIIPDEMREGVRLAMDEMFLRGEAPPAAELLLRHKDGSRVPVFSNHTVVDVAGRGREMYCIDIDLTERKRGEQALAEHARGRERLAQAAMRLQAPLPEADLYRFAAEQVGLLLPGAVVVANEHVAARREVVVRAVTGPEPKLERIRALLGRELAGMAFAIAEEPWRRMVGGELIEVEGGLSALSFGQLPAPLCETLEAELDLGRCWVAPLAFQGELMGTVAMLLERGCDIGDAGTLDLMRSQISLALKRQRTESALRESEARYRLIAENTADVIWTLDLSSGRFTYVSPSVARLRGWTAEEVMAQPFEASLTAESSALVRESLATGLAAFAVGEAAATPRTIEVDQPTRDGGVVPTEVVASLLIDASGRANSVLGVTRDIRDRRRVQQALAESEQQFRSLFEQSPLGIYRTAPDGRILMANPALLRMLGHETLEDLQVGGLAPGALRPELPSGELEDAFHGPGEPRRYDAVWTARDGRRVFVRENARAIRGADGAVLYHERTVEDITVHRDAEETQRRLATAVEQVGEAIVVTDRDGTITYVNPAFERITGYSRAEAIGVSPRILRSGRQDPWFYRTMWETIAAGSVWAGRLVNRRKDGTLYEEEMTISPLRDERGAIASFVAVKRDVSREAVLQRQLNQAQKMEAVGRLAGGIAHDFNNLLQAILSQLGMLQSLHAPGGATPIPVAELEQLVRRGASLTRQLLLFSRQETFQPQALDLGDVIRHAAVLLRRVVRENVAIVLDLVDAPLPVRADPGQLDQILMNLVLNASDAMPGGGQVTLRTGADGDAVWLAVADSGHGMSEAVRAHLFEPFFTTKAPGKGSGLGLSVVHGIVAAHGGTVDGTSVAGAGSTFTVRLPRAAAGGRAEPADGAPPSLLPRGSGQRILVVEDEEGARVGLVEILTQLGYEVAAAGSGEEALTLAERQRHDLVLSDLLLPGIPGSELVRALARRWPGIRVILMSGYAEDDSVRAIVALGGVTFLQKPFDMATLAVVMRRVLDDGGAGGVAD